MNFSYSLWFQELLSAAWSDMKVYIADKHVGCWRRMWWKLEPPNILMPFMTSSANQSMPGMKSTCQGSLKFLCWCLFAMVLLWQFFSVCIWIMMGFLLAYLMWWFISTLLHSLPVFPSSFLIFFPSTFMFLFFLSRFYVWKNMIFAQV